jgi:hypothetical protein
MDDPLLLFKCIESVSGSPLAPSPYQGRGPLILPVPDAPAVVELARLPVHDHPVDDHDGQDGWAYALQVLIPGLSAEARDGKQYRHLLGCQ